ncbi:Hypothetical protein A7982_09069 [Minicystis rosea]|nr:Hypothetical protein A7982_09069 [Minicystis rosea]
MRGQSGVTRFEVKGRVNTAARRRPAAHPGSGGVLQCIGRVVKR